MPREATGTLIGHRGAWAVQVTLDGGKRRAAALLASMTREEAEARARLVAGLINALRRAGKG